MMRTINGTNGSLYVRVVDTPDKALDCRCYIDQLVNLYRQLTDRTPAKNMALLVNKNFAFIFVTEGSNLVATLTLVIVRTGTTCKGLIEDVVVDQAHRKIHLGEALVEEALQLARNCGCQYVQLTSKPERAGTSAFYAKAGFEQIALANRDHPEGTRFYRYYFSKNKK